MTLIKLGLDSFNPDGTPILETDEKVHYSLPDVQLFFSNEKTEGFGTLFVTTKRVIWFPSKVNSSKVGFSVDFHQIMCHALAREKSFHFNFPCVYCQLDSEDETFHEMRFVPSNDTDLTSMYRAFSDCAAMNPDPEEEGEGDFVFDENEVAQGVENERRLQHLENVFQMPSNEQLEQMNNHSNGRYDDVEDEEEEEEQQQEKDVDEHHKNETMQD